MSDVHDIETRSYNMSRIKGKNTTPELIVRRYLHRNGFRYSLHSKKVLGKPDIVLRKYKTIIDIRGCFWHSHSGCKYGSRVSTSSEQITNRRNSAVSRDKINETKWRNLGWNIIIVWAECQLEPRKKDSLVRNETLKSIRVKLEDAYTSN